MLHFDLIGSCIAILLSVNGGFEIMFNVCLKQIQLCVVSFG